MFVLLLVHQISLALCCLTGKSGMYFVEDNATDAHDNQVKQKDCSGLFFPRGMAPHYVSQPGCCNTGCVYVFGQSIHGETEAPSFSWTYEEIKEVHKRWWQLRDNAVEIFLTNGRTLLLAFDNTKVRLKTKVTWNKMKKVVMCLEANANMLINGRQ